MPSNAALNSVILADDDKSLRGVLRSLLTEAGFQVLPVDDGLEAVELAATTTVRLVILDVRMPRLDGVKACARIRCLAGYQCVPIVMLSAYHGESIRAAAEQAGATLFLAKPISALTLKQAILPLLGEVAVDGRPSLEWQRRTEQTPALGETEELARGRRVLEIYRRGSVTPKDSTGADWFR